MDTWSDQFRQLYCELGFIDQDGGCLPLHRACTKAATLWAQVRDNEWPSPETAGIYRPWVGAKYRLGGLLVVGLNMNEAGGIDAYYNENGVPLAMKELMDRNRVLPDPTAG